MMPKLLSDNFHDTGKFISPCSIAFTIYKSFDYQNNTDYSRRLSFMVSFYLIDELINFVVGLFLCEIVLTI